jgi:hypothetical protein
VLLAGVATLAAVLVELLPLLGTSPSAFSEVAVLSLVALTVAVATGSVPRTLALVSGPAGLPLPRNAEVLVLRGPATDPAHHPVAPRAPGLA